ncbi:hypothetical protein K9M50_03335 [Patescibacteria group bacterium]|nr:hypothetical protein [Patescibacteria group bacterium]
MSIRYIVKIEKFAENHYIKKFSKKYKNYWEVTLKGLILELERFNELYDDNLISSYNNILIYKMYFRVAGTNFSRKSSGNRYIFSLDKNINEIKILLVYHKNDIGAKNETVAWKKLIKNNYDTYNFLK